MIRYHQHCFVLIGRRKEKTAQSAELMPIQLIRKNTAICTQPLATHTRPYQMDSQYCHPWPYVLDISRRCDDQFEYSSKMTPYVNLDKFIVATLDFPYKYVHAVTSNFIIISHNILQTANNQHRSISLKSQFHHFCRIFHFKQGQCDNQLENFETKYHHFLRLYEMMISTWKGFKVSKIVVLGVVCYSQS